MVNTHFCEHGETTGAACPICLQLLAAQRDSRSKPTERPPTNAEIAYDLEARARKLDELSRQLAREASDMAFAAKRIRERA